jgi:hypothetical protein
MFRREWWIAALGHGAVLSEGDNGTFEVNMVLLCDYVPKKALGSGSDSRAPGGVCQLAPGIFVHKEHEIIALWKCVGPDWDIDVPPPAAGSMHYKLVEADVNTLCLYFAMPHLVRLQRWVPAGQRQLQTMSESQTIAQSLYCCCCCYRCQQE